MLPTVGSGTTKIIWYAAEVAGRTLGVAKMENLVPDPAQRAALEASGQTMLEATKKAASAYVARVLFEYIDYRVDVGIGRGVDRGFDATVAAVAETIRTSLPDRSTANPDYRAVFRRGTTEEYTSPTVREDDELGATLRQAIADSSLAVKADVLARLDVVLPVVKPAAVAVREGEKKVNDLFHAELVTRKLVVDTLWSERKDVEKILGRAGRGVARFIFFDFRSAGPSSAEAPDAPAPPTPPADPDPPTP